jgi:hypothetical protein
MNRDLLKDAIADAKTVKETAIANAKIALEEAFTPHLKEMFAQKLDEMDEESMEEMEEMEDDDYVSEDVSEDVSLDELLAELEEEDDEEINIDEILSEVEDDEESNDEEGIEDMSEEDLKSFIEDIIKDMITNGELEAGEEETEDESEEEEEEVSIDELLAEMEMEEEDLNEYAETSPEEMLTSICNDYPNHQACKNFKPVAEAKKMKMDDELEEAKKDEKLEEAYDAIKSIRSELEEVKLLNSKLLYTNKLFKTQNLTESQKVKILNAFDKTTNTKEAKLVYETLSANVKNTNKKPLNGGFKGGFASKATSSSLIAESKKPIVEIDSQFARWQKLAGIK